MTTSTPSILDTLNADQELAVTSREKRLLVTAAPGTGKTRVLAARVVWLLRDRKMPSHEILCLVFTRSAAAELRKRVVAEVGEDMASLLSIGTLHSLALRLLRADPDGVAPGRVADAEEEREVFDSLFKGPERRRDCIKVGKREFKRALSHEASNGSHAADTTTGVFHARMAKRGLVTFGRIMGQAIAQSWNAKSSVSRALSRYRHVLVDEAHDLTDGEFSLVKAANAEETFVLDVRQAIFQFRGAHLGWFRAFRNEYAEVHLTRTYRFGPEIAKVASVVAMGAGQPPIQGSPDVADAVRDGDRECLAQQVEALGVTYGRGNVAILCRTNREADRIAASLGDVAYRVEAKADEGLRTVMALARLVINPNDNAAFRVLWRAGVGNRDSLRPLETQAGMARSLFAQAQADGVGGLGWGIVGAASMHTPDTFGVVWGRVRDYIRQIGDYPEHLWDLVGATPREALDALAEREDADSFAEAGDRIQVATAHASKGREWSCVIFADFKTTDSVEEQNVRFVAMTRAERELVILEPEEAYRA